MRKLFAWFCALAFAVDLSAQVKTAELTSEDLGARLKLVLQLARELNNRELVAKVEDTGKSLKAAKPANLATLETQVRELETIIGIDPGGWAMNGLKIAHPTPQLTAQLRENGKKLAEALIAEDLLAVKKTIAEMTVILGDQAGLPDARRKGQKARRIEVTAAENALIFLHALEGEGKSVRTIRDGKPLPDQMLRLYATVIKAICAIRPAVQQHAPGRLKELDAVARGACQILVDLQQPAGFFPFPDLRGKNIRFGEMTEHLLEQGGVTIKDGWVISPDPSGGSQFDTGECGVALLQAGQVYQNPAWTKAGLKAADWAAQQKCVPNFNYNSFSVSLLAQAFAVTKERNYWEAAWHKWELGVAPGQVANGRWIDPHNARTVYHLIILRAINDLLETKPKDLPTNDLASLQQAADKAVSVVTEEFEKLGVTNTSYALSELIRFRDLRPSLEAQLQSSITAAAALVHEKSVLGERAKFGASATEIAVLHRATKEQK